MSEMYKAKMYKLVFAMSFYFVGFEHMQQLPSSTHTTFWSCHLNFDLTMLMKITVISTTAYAILQSLIHGLES